MIRKQTLNGKEVTLTNEGLKDGDKVFPISYGSTATKKYVHRQFDFRDFMSGWPNEPHTIQEFYMDDEVRYVRTDCGYSPEECYFKIVE